MSKKFILYSVVLSIVFIVPAFTYAANLPLLNPNFTIVPDGCTKCPCGAGGALQFIQNVMNVMISLALLFLTFIMIWAGFLFIAGASNPEQRSKGKSMLTNAVIGLVIVLAGWLIVDFVMKKLYNADSQFGPWNQILTFEDADKCILAQDIHTISGLPSAQDAIVNGIGQGSGATPTPSGGGTATPGGGYTGGGITYQSGVQNQVRYESSQLGSLLSCMAGKLPSGAGQISAISENAIANGSKTMEQCAVSGTCAHTAYSCHYGGHSCIGASYAVDFGDEQNATAIRAAARSCNPSAKWNYEGNHVHVSVGAASGCGCDTGLSSI